MCDINKRYEGKLLFWIMHSIKVNFVTLYYQIMVKSSERYANRWTYLIWVVLIHTLWITFIQLQKSYGSRFFFPKRFRKYKHDYLKLIENDYRPNDIWNGNVPSWELWLGDLSTDGMLDIETSIKTYNKLKRRIGLYAVAPCEHKFHYTCLYTYLTNHNSWPKCSELIPKIQEYDD